MALLATACTKDLAVENNSENLYTQDEMETFAAKQGQGLRYENAHGSTIEGTGHNCFSMIGVDCPVTDVEIGCRGVLRDIDCHVGLHEILDKIVSGSLVDDIAVVEENEAFLLEMLPDVMVQGILDGSVVAEVVEMPKTSDEGEAYIEYRDYVSAELIMASRIIF